MDVTDTKLLEKCCSKCGITKNETLLFLNVIYVRNVEI